MSNRINVFGRPIEYDVGVTYDRTTGLGQPKILEPGIDDLSDDTKKAVITNISDTTRGKNDPDKKNRYPLGDGLNQISLIDIDGNPAELDHETNTSTRTAGVGAQFVEEKSELDALKNYSNSTVQSGRTLKVPGKIDALKKGKRVINIGEFDGNDLLRVGIDTIQETYVSPILSNNRFTATAEKGKNLPSTENGNPVSADDRGVRVTPDAPPEILGSYRAYREFPGGADVRNGHFANIGPLLTLRATSELASSTGYGQDGPDGLGASAAALLPGTAQIGLIRVDVNELTSMEAFKSLIADGTDPVNLDPSAANDHLINDFGSTSYGQMNNVLEPFSGILPLGMIAASTALVIAMKLALQGLTALLSMITSAKQGTVKKDIQGRYILGSFIHAAGSSSKFPPLPLPAHLLGLQDTAHDFQDCVSAGIDSVFGKGLGTSFERVVEAPGFYGVICRNIVRSAANIVIQVQNSIKGNPIQVAQNIIALIDIIRRSKVISAINIMAAIGDATLNLQDKSAFVETIFDQQKISTSDALPDDFRVGKSRMQGKTDLAWGNSTTPSAFLFPRETVTAYVAYQKAMGNEITPASLVAIKSETSTSSPLVGDVGKKIPSEVKEAIEAKLDAEYIPFYFHDLRTNEIISFHAFLRSISDDYNVESESIKPMGRIDPVKIYKSTERKIAIEFYCVSTNPTDFDQMWWKINKLVTLVYPQWSKGNQMTNPDTGDKFIQPFSQIPTNSPMIRLRLGDLFRSNYSRFALARLFGMGQPDSFFDMKVTDGAVTGLASFAEIVSNVDFEQIQGIEINIEPGIYPVGSKGFATIGKSSNVSSVEIYNPEPAKVNSKQDDGTFSVTLSERTDNDTIVVSASNIKLTKEALQKWFANKNQGELGDSVAQGDIHKVQDFLSPENNSIVRSFEAASGKGLACMIDNLGFSWLDNIPWETETYGSRAPRMCIIKMSLTPIHDIAPGIDANGFNRAPVYNVGEITNGLAGDSWDRNGAGREFFNDLQKRARTILR